MFAWLVVDTRRSFVLADQLRRTHCGTRHFFSRDLTVKRDAKHPCWKAAHFLPFTRPPDVMRLHRPQRGLIHHGPSERRAFVATRSGLHVLGGTHPLCSRTSRHLLQRAAYPEGTSSFRLFWCFPLKSRCTLLGERTGSLLGIISLSISDFSIGSVQCLWK
jgi:hypothetical protein